MSKDEVLNKLPAITLGFWIMKMAATTLGETAGDLLSMTLNIGYEVSSLILITAFLILLFFQLLSKKYRPWLYWSVILSTLMAGTTISDFMDRTLNLGYMTGSAILMSLLLVIFVCWHFSSISMSVANIRSRKVETLYWIAILTSNTLGTALGDFLADDAHLGFLGGAILIGSLLTATALAYFFTKMSHVALFWIAFVLTRPFGATFGDVLTKPLNQGELNLGTALSSAVLLSILAIGVVVSMIKLQRQPVLAAVRVETDVR